MEVTALNNPPGRKPLRDTTLAPCGASLFTLDVRSLSSGLHGVAGITQQGGRLAAGEAGALGEGRDGAGELAAQRILFTGDAVITALYR